MRRLILSAIACSFVATSIHAAEPASPVEPALAVAANDWRIAVSSYVWGAGLSGTTSVGNLPRVNIDFSFGDILRNLDFAYFGTAEIGYRRWLVFSDFEYVKLSIDGATPLGVLASRWKLRSETLSWILSGGYRVVDEDRWTVDALAGGRLYNVSNRLSISGGLRGSRARELSETWVDPIVGARTRIGLTPSIDLLGWGFVGGFGVGSDINWDVLGAVSWSPREAVSAIVGYRASGVDYSTTGFTYDAVQQGPVVGLIIRF